MEEGRLLEVHEGVPRPIQVLITRKVDIKERKQEGVRQTLVVVRVHDPTSRDSRPRPVFAAKYFLYRPSSLHLEFDPAVSVWPSTTLADWHWGCQSCLGSVQPERRRPPYFDPYHRQ